MRKIISIITGGIYGIVSILIYKKVFELILNDFTVILITILISSLLLFLFFKILHKTFNVVKQDFDLYAMFGAYFCEIVFLIMLLMHEDPISFIYVLLEFTVVLTGSFALFFLIRFLLKKVKEKRNR